MRHSFEYVLVLGAVTVANLLGARSADMFAAFVGGLGFHVWRSRRRVALDNLKQAFGERYSDRQRKAIAKDVFRNLGRTMVELARFRRLDHEAALKSLVVEGREHLEKAHRAGHGGVAITAHFGNWELLGGWVAMEGYPINVLAYPQHNRRVNDLVNGLRRRLGMEVIPVDGANVRRVFKSLRANQFIGIVADQHAPAQNLVLEFFGRKAAVAKGPALFAIRCGCPVLPYMMRRESHNRHVIMAGEPIYPPDGADEDTAVREMTRAYLGFFESVIAEYPGQWMWTHRRWKV
ncbi:MAG: lysophospholipid acyltransferase family protein [Candidatus Zixiibacteriota bacterium]|nr:MAG: lysophospholipid acyltransferase family protein [candidate division Zixibacteria bacterium]